MFFGWYTSATAKRWNEKKKEYTEFMSMFGVVWCILRAETRLCIGTKKKILSYINFEILERERDGIERI